MCKQEVYASHIRSESPNWVDTHMVDVLRCLTSCMIRQAPMKDLRQLRTVFLPEFRSAP